MKKIMSGKWNRKHFLVCQLESCCISPFLFYFSLLDTSIHKQKPAKTVYFAKIWHIFQQSWAKLSSYNLSQRFFMRRRTSYCLEILLTFLLVYVLEFCCFGSLFASCSLSTGERNQIWNIPPSFNLLGIAWYF